ncbi:MAG: FAD-binding protein [Deltaproteobacteria bacterium]|nr:FAD-binding protein [Deltaproteobacteria bacterium]
MITRGALQRDLERAFVELGFRGQVRLSSIERAVYATDASLYQRVPHCVVMPMGIDDLERALEVARRFDVAVLPRGAGTSLAGQATSTAIVVDTSRHMGALLEIDREQRWARVQPGIVRDELNRQIAKWKLQFAPDTATSNRACLGGMIGNNSAGMRSIRYGQTVDHVLELSLLLSDGQRLNASRLSASQWDARSRQLDREGELYRALGRIIAENADEIVRRYPKVMRRVAGYRLDALVDTARSRGLVELLCGSEGTLALVAEAKIALQPLPTASCLAVAHFSSLSRALRAVPLIVGHRPSAVELLDDHVLQMARACVGTSWRYRWLSGRPEAVLIVEFEGESAAQVAILRERIAAELCDRQLAEEVVAVNAEDVAEVWDVRRSGLGLLLGTTALAKPLPFIEDAAVPVEELADYIAGVQELCRREGVPMALYAHASVGLIHCRPFLDLRLPQSLDTLRRISEAALALVVKHRGSFSGEHGDGRVRSYALPRFYGEQIYAAFVAIKRLFDPLGLLNPGIIVDAEPIDRGLRIGPDYRTIDWETTYRFRREGSLAAAVELCSGVGACRKRTDGVMCPSYRATGEERHSTRGRANALRMAISGQLGRDALSSAELYEVFSLCLGCKGCKSECPSNVDVARLKAEFLQRYHQTHGASASERFFAGASDWARRLSGPTAGLANRLMQSTVARTLLERTFDVDRRRKLPALAKQPFEARSTRRTKREGRPTLRLFVDCYANYYSPQIATAAVDVLEAIGYSVEPLTGQCCGRTQLSLGFLDRGREIGARALRAVAAAEQPLITLEPSCHSALVDDLPDLIDEPALCSASERIVPFDRFVAEQAQEGHVPPIDRALCADRYLVHSHCHERALGHRRHAADALERWTSQPVTDLDAGCCGMAGAFGYLRANYEVSMRVGRELFAAIGQSPNAQLIAGGFSCRHQVADGARRDSCTLAEALSRLIRR